MTHKAIIFSLFILATYISVAQFPGQVYDKSVIFEDSVIKIETTEIAIHSLTLPKADTHGSFSERIVTIKKFDNKLNFLKFPRGGTETNIYLIDSVYANNFKEIRFCPHAKDLRFFGAENGLLDISDLIGTYYVSYQSCNVFGSYRIRIAK